MGFEIGDGFSADFTEIGLLFGGFGLCEDDLSQDAETGVHATKF